MSHSCGEIMADKVPSCSVREKTDLTDNKDLKHPCSGFKQKTKSSVRRTPWVKPE